uniref:Uncharacterized protein n=1 Tax=Mycena chlorophos TaxID=658473 RepID=A0ABQ0LSA2_MYCCL|nr:predicted protein [Mycena chlorophos]
MPRLIPRLIKIDLSGEFLPPRKISWPDTHSKPVPPSPPPNDPTRSLLLTPGNPITNARDYVRHKSRPTVFRLRETRKTESGVREMTPEERGWWSNPYLRMLASPVRQCLVSQRLFPTDLLIRLTSMRPPSTFKFMSKMNRVLVPDGVLHHAFKRRRSATGIYVICNRETVLALQQPRWWKMMNGVGPPRLAEQVMHQLRLRILQEVFLLLRAMKHAPSSRATRPPIIRRLRRAEWMQLRETGVLPYPGALAVVVLPPVNRDAETKERALTKNAFSAAPVDKPKAPPTEAALNPSPLAEDITEFKRELPPLSVLHPVSASALPLDDAPLLSFFRPLESSSAPRPLATERIPLFNGVALLPSRTHRAKLHEMFSEMLKIEARQKRRAGDGGTSSAEKKRGDNKASHAFLICASDELDVGALGVALWRARLFEGA